MEDVGTLPNMVGDILFKAKKEDIFYILTDTKLTFRRILQNRMERILEAYGQNNKIHKTLKCNS